MAGINTTISIIDRATEALRRISASTNGVTDSMNRANKATSTAFDNSHIPELQQDMLNAAASVSQIADNANEATVVIIQMSEASNMAAENAEKIENAIDRATGSVEENNNEARKLPENYKDAASEADNLNSVLGKVLSTAMLIKGVSFVSDWVNTSIDLANTQQKVEQQLKNVLANSIPEQTASVYIENQSRTEETIRQSTELATQSRIDETVTRTTDTINRATTENFIENVVTDSYLRNVENVTTDSYLRNVETKYSEAEIPEIEDINIRIDADTSPVEDAFEKIKAKASQLQSITMYGDEAYIAGAAELSTYIQDMDALMIAMDTLANYAAGMSGGAELDSTAMTDYATQLGKVFTGAYDGIKKKGFELTDVQKEVIERGNDMQKALILSQVINESWEGLAKDMANLPSGQIAQFQNAWGDFREEIGERLQPAVGNLFATLNEHMPQIHEVIGKGTDLIIGVIDGISNLIDAAGEFYDYVSDNWSTIGPIVTAIAIAVGACAAAMGIYTVATKLATAAQAIWSSTAVQAATAVAASIAAATLAVTLYDDVTIDGANNSYTALGIVAGAWAAVTGAIWNGVLLVAQVVGTVLTGIWNAVASVANFVGNVFTNPVGSVIKLFVDMADVVLGVLQGIAEAIDWVFGSELASGIQGWRDDMYAFWEDEWSGNEEFAPKIDQMNLSKTIQSYGAQIDEWAVNAYNWGDDFTKKFSAQSKEDVNKELEDIMNNMQQAPNNPYEGMTAEQMLEEINRLNGTAEDVKNNTASSTDLSEILRLLRDISEREAINKFTTAEIKLDIGGITQNVNSREDIGSLADYIASQLEEAVSITASKSNYAF